MAFTANGSAITFAGTSLGVVQSITPDIFGDTEIEVTGVASTRHEYEAGMDDPNISVTVLGFDTVIDRGDAGDLVLTPQGVAAQTVADCVCVGKTPGEIGVDGALTTVYRFRATTVVP